MRVKTILLLPQFVFFIERFISKEKELKWGELEKFQLKLSTDHKDWQESS
jgi:hypothetical protein